MNALISLLCSFAAVLFVATPAFAAATPMSGDPLLDGILSTVLYSAIGMIMAFIAFKVIDLLTPGHLGKAISENNIALAVLAGLTMLGICIIIAAVLSS